MGGKYDAGEIHCSYEGIANHLMLWLQGTFAVALFFVISGYALSVSILSKIHTQRPGESLRLDMQIGCSFPRRWVRLYVPVIATTFIFMTTWYLSFSRHEQQLWLSFIQAFVPDPV